MTDGHLPRVTIGVAKRQAAAWGMIVIGISCATKLPFDFITHKDGVTSIVRVCRLKNTRFSVDEVYRQCTQDLRELGNAPVPGEVIREIWILGPERGWHRYCADVDDFLGIVTVSYIPTVTPERKRKAGTRDKARHETSVAQTPDPETGTGPGEPAAGLEPAERP